MPISVATTRSDDVSTRSWTTCLHEATPTGGLGIDAPAARPYALSVILSVFCVSTLGSLSSAARLSQLRTPHLAARGSLMQFFRLLALPTVLFLHACGGGEGPTPPAEDDPPDIDVPTVSISPAGATLTPGQIMQFSATARDSRGTVIASQGAQWSWNGRSAFVSAGGHVHAVAPGNTLVTATLIGLTKIELVSVTAPAKTAGAFLTIGSKQFGSSLFVTTLNTSDTAASGQDRRLGIVRTSNSSLPPTARATHPSLDVIAECPNGEVYGFEESTEYHGHQLWRVNPQNAEATLVGEMSVGPLSAMTCDASNSLVAATQVFGLVSNLYRVSRTNGSSQRFGESDTDAIVGLAFAPNGTLYGTIYDPFVAAPQPQRLVTINTTNGAVTPVGTDQPRRLPQIRSLFFRGDRLLGVTGMSGSLRELNLSSGENTTIRTVTPP